MKRGLICCDRKAAVDALRRIGYYRFSAYVYSFRELLPAEQRGVASPAHYRSERLLAGATFEQVLALWQFDRELRLLTLDAMETIEVALRTQLAYVLGERDPFGHLRVESLGPNAVRGEPKHDSLTPTKKGYSALAVSAYLVKALEPSSSWPRRLRTHVTAMNWARPLDPASNTGSPPEWECLTIWS